MKTNHEPLSIAYVVDDDEPMRTALHSLLCSIGLRVRTFSAPADFLSCDKPSAPSCLILDVRLRGENGLRVQEEMAGAGVHLPIVFITGYGDVEMSVKAMKAGAVDFLRKPFRDQDILDAVSDALRRDEARLASDEAMFALRTSYGTLTSREREVMSYVVDGMLNKQVAAILKLSEITVKTHRAQVMRKLACRSLADLVRKAETLGIGSHSCIPSLRQTATPS